MKTQIKNYFTDNSKEISEVKNAEVNHQKEKSSRVFTSAEFWNLQKQKREFVQRRGIF